MSYNYNPWDYKPATERQLRLLERLDIKVNGRISKAQAHWLIQENKAAWERLEPTHEQLVLLHKWGCWRHGMRRGEATAIIENTVAQYQLR